MSLIVKRSKKEQLEGSGVKRFSWFVLNEKSQHADENGSLESEKLLL